MFSPVQPDATAWQPLTPRGVATFAYASGRRLLAFQLAAALIAAGIVCWILATQWFPTLRTAIRQLPERSRIQDGRLAWAGSSSQLLARGNFLAVSVDLEHSGAVRYPAHLLVEFGRTDLQLHSLLGYYSSIPYPRSWTLPLDRHTLEPWWGAWSPVLLGLVGLLVALGLMVSWAVLASVYAPFVWLLALYGNRILGLRQAWKLAGAALLPGAILEMAVLAGYGLARLDCVQLLAGTAAHFLVGWIFLLVCPFLLPRVSVDTVIKGNPFVTSPEAPRPAPPDRTPDR